MSTITNIAGGTSPLNLSGPAAQVTIRSNGDVVSFLSSLTGGLIAAAAQIALFLALREILPRIYSPRTYLVPERERVKNPSKGLFRWAPELVYTSNNEFIAKCGLDAYFFLRYLRMLLKIFIPFTLILCPILLCLNAIGGRGDTFGTGQFSGYDNVTGINQLSWGNVRPDQSNRYWGHCICAIIVIVYCCYVFWDELEGYVRLRQAYLTSPQHRLRASATTVLVSAIPRKWCTAEALNGLYDVFPGGVRNIWINRDYYELSEKVRKRKIIAGLLEIAETDLIRNANKVHLKREAKGRKETKQEKKEQEKIKNEKANAMAESNAGRSTNAPDQVHDTLEDETMTPLDIAADQEGTRRRPYLNLPIPVVGRGLELLETGMTGAGRTILDGLKSVGRSVEDTVINPSQGLQTSSQDHLTSELAEPSKQQKAHQAEIAPYDGAQNSTMQLEDDYPDLQTASSDGSPRSEANRDGQSTAPQSSTPLSSKGDANHQDQHKLGRPQTPESTHVVNTIPIHAKTKWTPWRTDRNKIDVPAPFPHGYDANKDPGAGTRPQPKQFWQFWRKSSDPESYDIQPYDEEYIAAEDDPLWKKYLKPGDRQTMRIPPGDIEFLGYIPFLGKKVDTIDYCRKELARLNLEIDADQAEQDKYPLMNSAFIQFNHQIAAHMACQSVSHHTAMHMAPRAVEISPRDVIWSNMSVRWWEKWLRTALVIFVIFWLVILWVVPVAFTGVISNLHGLAALAPWLNWIGVIPSSLTSILQGILPTAFLALLLFLVPVFMRLLARFSGAATGVDAELSVQWYFFVFLFVQVFLVVTLSASLGSIVANINATVTLDYIPSVLAQNLPTAANYFFNYIFLQACTVSASVLAQVAALFSWFVVATIFDSTARQKWRRETGLPFMQWGTFFPIYTNFACLGLIYCCVAPLMAIFLVLTFSLFWFVYRYQTLYITRFTQDTGGLLFPRAINQLFVGLYFMELCLFGLFLLVQGVDEEGQPQGNPCQGQAILMFVVFVCTIIYQALLNKSLGPLMRYLPITLEDDAVIRDEEFARAQDKRLRLNDPDNEEEEVEHALREREHRSLEEDRVQESNDVVEQEQYRHGERDHKNVGPWFRAMPSFKVPKTRSRSQGNRDWVTEDRKKRAVDVNAAIDKLRRQHRLRALAPRDKEAGQDKQASIADALFSGVNDEIEDLSPEDRDLLIQRAFRHEAVRARRPVIWIPKDELGISEDEMRQTKMLTDHIWISNEHTGLDAKCRVVFRKCPPDFEPADVINL